MKYINLSHEQFEHCAWLISHAWSDILFGGVFWNTEEGDNPTNYAALLINEYLTSI